MARAASNWFSLLYFHGIDVGRYAMASPARRGNDRCVSIDVIGSGRRCNARKRWAGVYDHVGSRGVHHAQEKPMRGDPTGGVVGDTANS
jgi:hypothetical protein